MKKIVVKTALITIGLVLAGLAAAFAVASLGFPRQMSDFFASSGNYSFATGYASLSYNYTKDFNDLVLCADYSILSGDDGNVISFCSKLAGNENFGAYCIERDAETQRRLEESGVSDYGSYNYRQYVMGNLACSQYALGYKDEAVKTAASAMEGGFPKNNALAMLAIKACSEVDAELKEELFQKISSVTPEPQEEEYLAQILEILK